MSRKGVMSPDNPRNEAEGMARAQRFFAARPGFSREMVREFGETFHKKYANRRMGFADGFKLMTDLISRGRESRHDDHHS